MKCRVITVPLGIISCHNVFDGPSFPREGFLFRFSRFRVGSRIVLGIRIALWTWGRDSELQAFRISESQVCRAARSSPQASPSRGNSKTLRFLLYVSPTIAVSTFSLSSKNMSEVSSRGGYWQGPIR
jgi:hypothetical protein